MNTGKYLPWSDPKLWTAIINFVASLAVYFVGRYCQWATQDIVFVIGAVQQLALAILALKWHAENLLARQNMLPQFIEVH